MAANADSEVPSFGFNRSSAESSEFINKVHPSFQMLSKLPDPANAGNSSLEDTETTSREALTFSGADSGLSEMDMTSSRSTSSSPDLERDPHMGSNVSFTEGMEAGDDVDDDDDEDDDDGASTVSEISGISNFSGQEWKLSPGALTWVHRQMISGVNPREVLGHFVDYEPILRQLPPNVDDFTLWKILLEVVAELPRRKKLPHVNTLDDVVRLIKNSSKILVLTGAGVSVSCGIPDFRSPTGVYARLAKDFPDLPDPQAMFDIHYFNRDPRPFYKFAREIYPGRFEPSPCHRFIKALETHGKLLRNYTQNIDTLEQVAGIQKVVQCHGSFASATCTNCKRKVTADDIREDILSQRIPVCTVCIPDPNDPARVDPDNNYQGLVARGVMKPDIVFFGEGLPEDFHDAMSADRDQADLLLVIGSSLKVRPVALIPNSVPEEVPQILINREQLPQLRVDVELLGDADVLVDHLCRALGDSWTELCWRDKPLVQLDSLPNDEVCPTTSISSEESSRKRLSEEINDCGEGSSQPAKKLRVDSDAETSGVDESEWKEVRPIKLRQMSSDSTRDSGIAETGDEAPSLPLSSYPPEGCFLFLKPSRYIFPGAEVYQRQRKRCISSTDSDLDSSPTCPSSPMPMSAE